jgi:hypothetical protein
MTAVAEFFNGLVTVILNLLITPAATELTALQTLMWAGLIFGFLGLVISLIKGLASRG